MESAADDTQVYTPASPRPAPEERRVVYSSEPHVTFQSYNEVGSYPTSSYRQAGDYYSGYPAGYPASATAVYALPPTGVTKIGNASSVYPTSTLGTSGLQGASTYPYGYASSTTYPGAGITYSGNITYQQPTYTTSVESPSSYFPVSGSVGYPYPGGASSYPYPGGQSTMAPYPAMQSYPYVDELRLQTYPGKSSPFSQEELASYYHSYLAANPALANQLNPVGGGGNPSFPGQQQGQNTMLPFTTIPSSASNKGIKGLTPGTKPPQRKAKGCCGC